MEITPSAIYQADCLALLERLESGQVTLAYLDPPWNTGSAFSNDEVREAELREHWLFTSKVLQQVQRVLSKSGSLYLHLDPRVTGHIRPIVDRVFGRENFQTEIIWPRHRRPSVPSLTTEHDTIALYGKSDSFIHNPQFRSLSDSEINRRHSCSDEKGAFQLRDLTSPAIRPFHQFEWRGIAPLPTRSWRYSMEQLDQLDSEGSIYYSPRGGLPKLKVYLDESPSVPVGSVWDDIPPTSPRGQGSGKYPVQRPLALLERIVRMGSSPGDLVLDPFCRAGTTLVAAQANDRRWLGCESTHEGYTASVERMMETFDLQPGIDFSVGDQPTLERFPVICNVYTSTALVVTEGKTDWKHLKAALTKLQNSGRFRELSLEFREYEDDLGDTRLLEECRQLSQTYQPHPTVCVFDRDNPKAFRQVSSEDGAFKRWGNNVFSFAIPVPHHRQETLLICIELYYKDSEIKRVDDQGRRLFLSNEFDPDSGRHKEDTSFNCTDLGNLRKSNRLYIVDNGVFDENLENVALPKSEFADYVLTQANNFDDFDASAFADIFKIISTIVETTRYP